MATQQTSTSQKSRGRAQAKASGTSRASASRSATDERDDTYALISVIYHALQGAETIGQYIQDARAADNEELVAFLEECKGRQNEIAMKGKQLLGEQLYETVGNDEDDEEDDDD
jgi:hypothetical protein